MKTRFITLLVTLMAFVASATGANNDNDMAISPDSSDVKVKISTSLGDITVLLYGATPRHRDNFIKLVKEGYYDGTLFHRVIKDFMIQAGDPDSKGAPADKMLGAGGPGYQIDAEILFPRHYHKRGALAAARQADQVNPLRRSSGSQFYIVTGRKLTPPQLARMEQDIDNNAKRDMFNKLAEERRQELVALYQSGDTTKVEAIRQDLINKVETYFAANPVQLDPVMIEDYKKLGGAPHLDGDYTVFGEVIDGMDVVDKIEQVETGRADRPVADVVIKSMEILK